MDMGVLSLLGILLAMALFIVGVYKGFPIMIIGPVSAVVVLLFSGRPII